jgi:site-specific DNA recombinase
MIRAAIYARYSSDNQRDASIDDQVRLCREMISGQGWTLVHVYRDAAMSGASALRPGYQGLLEAVREVACDVVVAEALDRLSRDQEDVAALFKRARYAGIRLVTLAEGEITELHVGLKGTMNALYLKDLAAKTHRGLRGRVEAGHSAGGNAYGYKVVRQFDADGARRCGQREVDPSEAAVVVRVFRDYAAGLSPKRIALALNAEGIAAPRGGHWSASTLNGNRARGTGLLNNELYVGRVVWNRLTYIKDPETGRRRSRLRGEAEQVIRAAPGWRIVTDALWDQVKARQAGLGRAHVRHIDLSKTEPAPFWSKQRPRYLFSGLMRCGECGGGFSKISASHFGCSTARNKGVAACRNRLTVRRQTLEDTVLAALRERLMDPALFREFAASFVEEWNRLQADEAGDREARASELTRVGRQIDRLVDAIAEGTPAAAVKERLAVLEARRLELDALARSSTAPAPRLHLNLAEVYRRKVVQLADVLMKNDAAEARELVRGLVESITLAPDSGALRIEVRGELAAILGLASGGRSESVLAEQVKMVAGTGFEPVTFRL